MDILFLVLIADLNGYRSNNYCIFMTQYIIFMVWIIFYFVWQILTLSFMNNWDNVSAVFNLLPIFLVLSILGLLICYGICYFLYHSSKDCCRYLWRDIIQCCDNLICHHHQPQLRPQQPPNPHQFHVVYPQIINAQRNNASVANEIIIEMLNNNENKEKEKDIEISIDMLQTLQKRTAEDQCPICLEKYKKEDQIIVLKCTHYSHTKCHKKWILKNNNINQCTLCKMIINP